MFTAWKLLVRVQYGPPAPASPSEAGAGVFSGSTADAVETGPRAVLQFGRWASVASRRFRQALMPADGFPFRALLPTFAGWANREEQRSGRGGGWPAINVVGTRGFG